MDSPMFLQGWKKSIRRRSVVGEETGQTGAGDPVGFLVDLALNLLEAFHEGFGERGKAGSAARRAPDAADQQGAAEAPFGGLDSTPHGPVAHFQLGGGRVNTAGARDSLEDAQTAQAEHDIAGTIHDPDLGSNREKSFAHRHGLHDEDDKEISEMKVL
jgi:hypothetical protein